MISAVGLRWSAGADVAVLSAVTGQAELAVTDTGARSAIALVDALLVAAGDTSAPPGVARSLAVADRDRILVQVHLDLYGPTIDSTLVCRRCGERYDLDFRLDELVAHCEPPDDAGAPPWRLGDIEFRPLTGDDELAVLGDADRAGALLRRVVHDPGQALDARDGVAEALARLTPSVAAPIGATCPECGAEQPVEFDVQRYLLARLLGEQRRLWRAVHAIAATYHWSRTEILTLPRREREAYVEAIGARTR